MIHISRNFLALSSSLLIGVLQSTVLSAQPIVISDLVEGKAVVESVDQKSRTVLLRDDHGDLETIIASPEVRNLAQVHPGDHVLVSVHPLGGIGDEQAGLCSCHSCRGDSCTG